MALGADFSGLSREVIGCAIAVHRALGPGLLEDTYEQCLAYELKVTGFEVRVQSALPLKYRELTVPFAYRVDLLVNDQLIVELKTVEKLTSLHAAQLLTYLRLANRPAGLLINFNSESLRHGIRRVYNSRATTSNQEILRSLRSLPHPL